MTDSASDQSTAAVDNERPNASVAGGSSRCPRSTGEVLIGHRSQSGAMLLERSASHSRFQSVTFLVRVGS